MLGSESSSERSSDMYRMLGNARPKYAEIIAFLLDSWFTFRIFYYVFKNTVTRRLVLTLFL